MDFSKNNKTNKKIIAFQIKEEREMKTSNTKKKANSANLAIGGKQF
jgi:hypothetical protein